MSGKTETKSVTITVSGPRRSGKTCIARLIRRHLHQLGVSVEIHDPNDRPSWIRLMRAFQNISHGSRVIIRTRTPRTATKK